MKTINEVFHIMERKSQQWWLREVVFPVSNPQSAREMYEDRLRNYPALTKGSTRLVRCEVLVDSEQMTLDLQATPQEDKPSPFAMRNGQPMAQTPQGQQFNVGE